MAEISMRTTTSNTPKAKTSTGSIVLTIVLLSLPFLDAGSLSSTYSTIIGRLHPLIVHFPIVLILSTVLMEWFFGSLRGPIGVTILKTTHRWSMYTAALSTFCGYLLFSTGDYSGSNIQYHLWGGVIVTILMIWSLVFKYRYEKTHRWRWRQLYRTFLFIAGAMVIYTGHLGGMLTHGNTYLTDPIKKAIEKREYNRTRAMTSPQSLKIFGDILLPAMEKKCLQCHNSQNSKSDLDLSTYAETKAGGKSLRPMIVPGRPDSSELHVRINLPPKHEEYMPPDGKPALHPTEVRLLAAWIQNGANEDDTLGQMRDNDTLWQAIDAYLPTLANHQMAAEAMRRARLRMGPKLIRLGHELGVEIRPDIQSDSARYTLSMQFPPKVVTDETLAQLMDYKKYFSKVSLVASDITDEGLFYLGQMSNLQEVILTKTCLQGNGLAYLKKLKKLTLLNLSHTDLNNQQLLHITEIPTLKIVHLFNTYITEDFAKILDAHLPATEISFAEGDYY